MHEVRLTHRIGMFVIVCVELEHNLNIILLRLKKFKRNHKNRKNQK
jgi:hypothetical protein